MVKRILFVCLGNICRSPSAEAVLRHHAELARLDIEVDSAGTGRWHLGEPPYLPMQAAAGTRGYDLSVLRARQVSVHDFGRFDLIVAMDESNLADLRAMRAQAKGTAELALFMDYAPQHGLRDVPDPYYSRNFDEALDLIEDGVRGLLAAQG